MADACLTRMIKDDEFIDVHPSNVANHQRIGWRVVDRTVVDELKSRADVLNANVGRMEAEIVERQRAVKAHKSGQDREAVHVQSLIDLANAPATPME